MAAIELFVSSQVVHLELSHCGAEDFVWHDSCRLLLCRHWVDAS